METRADRFPLLDSVRALAFMMVLAAHVAFFFAPALRAPGAPFGPVIARFDISVRLFFLISGFLIYRPFVRARLEDTRPPLTRGYAWRRVLRIVPLYWVALTVITIWLALPHVFTLEHGPLYYFFGQVYGTSATAAGGLPQGWSLCTEAGFYALVPLWALLMRRLPARDAAGRLRNELYGAVALAAISIAYKALVAVDAQFDIGRVQLQLNTLAYLDDFAIGMVLSALSVWYRDERRPEPRVVRAVDRRPSLAWIVAGAALLVAMYGIGLTSDPIQKLSTAQYLGKHALYEVMAAAILFPLMFGDQTRGLLRRLLANRFLIWLGILSYGCYLWHWPILRQMGEWHFVDVANSLGRWSWWVVAFPISIAFAAASYYVIERPFLRMKGRVRMHTVEYREATAEPAPVGPPAV